MAASGSAVGLGNIWGFPTQAASNGGGAFLLVYLVLAFTLAYPALMAEIIIGKQRNGPIGKCKLAFKGQYTKILDLAPGSYDDDF